MVKWKSVLPPETFRHILHQYTAAFSFGLAVISSGRVWLNRCSYYPWRRQVKSGFPFERMVLESIRWGEPAITIDEAGSYVWCVPISMNSTPLGGIFSASDCRRTEKNLAVRVREAAWQMLELATHTNVCNSSLMQMNRMVSQSNAQKADAIHSYKKGYYQNPRDIYLIEERGLLSAVRMRNLNKAREIINRILVGVYAAGNRDFDTLKTMVLEMVVQMYRAAVDEGADPRELLGINSTFLKDFHDIEDDEALNAWLTEWLELFISTPFQRRSADAGLTLAPAIHYIKNNLDKPLTRDEVARACNLSSGYFSRLVRLRTGYTFTTLLQRFRVERARALLEKSRLTVSETAFEAGFSDQSYFTKVFKKYTGTTPKEYQSRCREQARTDHPYGSSRRQSGPWNATGSA
jgi:AraC-like DNA-binding protein